MTSVMTAQEWFALGERARYDHQAKKILHPHEPARSASIVNVFHRLVAKYAAGEEGVWTTFLPGFPDGSYGWSKVDPYLQPTPRLFIEYVGQGDSDKPSEYPYGTMERADLVEAQWRAHGIASTFIVTFDYSSLVALELLSRQLERENQGEAFTRIEKVLLINGGLFADAHSHPWLTTPLLKTPFGKVLTWVAQHSRAAFDPMLKGLFSEEYAVTSEELGELYDAITRRNGAAFMSRAAGFVDEHEAHADRWDFRRVFFDSRASVSFHVLGTEEDPFEPKQILRARERLGRYGLDVRVLPGGHMATSEQPAALAEIIHELAPRPAARTTKTRVHETSDTCSVRTGLPC